MTLELSSHVLSFSKKLFLSVIVLFLVFAICFMAFQYRREKEYKIELLNTQLQNYNDRLNDFLRGKDTLNLRLLDKYVHEHTLDELRVTLIDKEGKVLYDNIEQNPLYFSNHLNREEIKEAISQGSGAVMKGTVETLKDYGAFVELENGLTGLLHISQISTKRKKTIILRLL